MNRNTLLRHHISAAFLLTLGLACGMSPAHAQTVPATDAEPNNSCAAAQDLSTATFPVTIPGRIEASDVDFYRFTGTPGSRITIDQKSSGTQPLGDPLMAVYSGNCATLLALDDYSGGYWDAQITLTVPESGSFVVAASAYPDYELTGSIWNEGTYTLSITPLTLAQGVVGRVIDALTGAPVSASVMLTYCPGNYCIQDVGYAYTGATGEFRFEEGSYSLYGMLRTGQYRIRIVANNYEEVQDRTIHLAEGELLNLGDVALTPLPAVGSIRGRAVDSLTGAPLPGRAAPYAEAYLLYCPQNYTYCWTERYGDVDAQGYFKFESNNVSPLRPGTYYVQVNADQYQNGQSARFDVADQQHADIGNVGLESFPVRVNLTQSCGGAVPTTGGTCNFTVKISNGMPTRLHGESWSTIRANGLASAVAGTTFQADKPQVLNLAPGASVNLPFSFFVPGEARDGTYICVETYASQRPHLFNTLGHNDVFCLRKGGQGFTLVPENQKRNAVKAAKGEQTTQP
jgi:hypothetical protein